MQQLLTVTEARRITGGRKPLVPIDYEKAVKALEACLTIDEAKVWSDKSDALAAWAKIYHDDKISRQAKALKLHAYRRMGILAEELRPTPKSGRGTGVGNRYQKGARSLLRESGLDQNNAEAARAIARLSEEKFRQLVNQDNPRTPMGVRRLLIGGRSSADWMNFNGRATSLRSVCRVLDPAKTAASTDPRDLAHSRAMVRELINWLDEFEQHLPEDKQ